MSVSGERPRWPYEFALRQISILLYVLYLVFFLARSFISIHISLPVILMFIMPETNAALKKKYQELRDQVNALSEEIRKLKEHISEHSSSPDRGAQSMETALQIYSDEHDES